MRKISTVFTTIALAFASVNSVQAQVQKGNHIVGIQVGNIVLSQRENLGNAIQLKPTYGFFIKDNLAVGLAIPFYYFSGGIPKNSVRVMQVGLTPFIRYYIDSGNVKPFLGIAGGTQRTSVKEGGSPDSVDFAWLYSAGGGVAFFLNKSVSFDIAANYTGADKEYYSLDSYAQNGLTTGIVNAININIGFQLYFGGR